MKTVNLELAQQLKEAGYPQESQCYWVKDFDNNPGWRVYFVGEMCGVLDDHYEFSTEHLEGHEFYTAPTADEIIEQFPIRVVPLKGDNERTSFYHDLQISRNLYYYEIDYRREWQYPLGVFHKAFFKHGLKNKVLANVCAEMWLFLKKERYFDKFKYKAVWVDKSYDRKIRP